MEGPHSHDAMQWLKVSATMALRYCRKGGFPKPLANGSIKNLVVKVHLRRWVQKGEVRRNFTLLWRWTIAKQKLCQQPAKTATSQHMRHHQADSQPATASLQTSSSHAGLQQSGWQPLAKQRPCQQQGTSSQPATSQPVSSQRAPASSLPGSRHQTTACHRTEASQPVARQLAAVRKPAASSQPAANQQPASDQ